MGDFFAWGLPLVLVAFLVSAGIEDIRTREIANWKNAAIALLAIPWWFAIGISPWPGMVIQFGIAAAVFAVFAGAFSLGMMGGGDVKMIGAIALWLPLGSLVWMLIVMSLIGGAMTAVMLVDHRRRRAEGQVEIPYGVAIAAATLMLLHEPLLNHFG